jgi:hypothetical protein
MFLFTRRVRFAGGNTRDAMDWALAQTDKANKISGLTVRLFAQVYSPEVGSISWSTFVPDLGALEAGGDKLNTDDDFVTATDDGAALIVGGAHDTLSQVVFGQPDPEREIEYVTSVRAVCATGSLARGTELGVEIAQRAEKITGTPTMFLADVTGTYGGVGWISGHQNVRALQKAQEALQADASWAQYLDKHTRGVYAEAPFLTTQLIYRHLA